MGAGWTVSRSAAPFHEACHPDSGVFSWEQKHLAPEKFQFESKQDAAAAVKKAAKTYGADIVGITRRDSRWDYAEFSILSNASREHGTIFPLNPRP